jgi:hypothetical protein
MLEKLLSGGIDSFLVTTNSNVLIGLRMPFSCHIRHNGKTFFCGIKKPNFGKNYYDTGNN